MNSRANSADVDADAEPLAASVDLHLDLRESVTPGARGVRAVLLNALRDAVRSGRLRAGTVLPPSRALSADLGVSRNTVAEVYAELTAEGWLTSRQGAGTWVSHAGGLAAAPAHPRSGIEAPAHNLMPGSPDVSMFPRSAWLASARRALNAAPNEALRMGDPRGRPELRTAVAGYLARVRGVRTSPDNIVITAGTRHAVDILARLFGPDGPIAVEAYGLFLFRDCIAEAGARSTPIGVDQSGAVVDDLANLDVSAALVTPAHHFPLGVPMHPSRRSAVVDWAQRIDRYVVEDDYDGEFRYDRQPVGALQGMDPDRVLYLGSTSKSLTPVLRMGWMVLPANLVDAAVAASGGQQWYVDGIAQLTMADFIDSGNHDKHIRRMRGIYRRRRDTMLRALAPFAPRVRVVGLPAGLHVLLLLPDGAEQEVLRRAAEAGLGIEGLARARHPQVRGSGIENDGVIVNFGTPGEHGFPVAVDVLCRVLADTLS